MYKNFGEIYQKLWRAVIYSKLGFEIWLNLHFWLPDTLGFVVRNWESGASGGCYLSSKANEKLSLRKVYRLSTAKPVCEIRTDVILIGKSWLSRT